MDTDNFNLGNQIKLITTKELEKIIGDAITKYIQSKVENPKFYECTITEIIYPPDFTAGGNMKIELYENIKRQIAKLE